MSDQLATRIDAAMPDDDSIEEIGASGNLWAAPLVRLVSILGVFCAWEIFGRQVSPLFMSYPSAIGQAAWRMLASGELLTATMDSLRILAIGFVAGVAIAAVLGLLIGRYRYVEAAVDWLVIALYATPLVALVPLIVLWLGYGDATKLFIVITHAFFPVVINTTAGVRNVSPTLMDVGQAFGTNERQLFRLVIIPAVVPYMVAGARLAVGRAIIGMVVGEFFTAATGLGALIVKYGNQYQTAPMFVPILLLMILGVLSTVGVEKLEAKMMPWKSAIID